MSRINYTPYNINIPYELKTYKNVGKDYGNSKDANKGWLLNIGRFYRKWKNRKENTYKFCNTYSDWEEHIIKDVLNMEIYNYSDRIHWLELKRKNTKIWLETIKIVLIPAYFTIVTSANSNIEKLLVQQYIKFNILGLVILMVTVASVIVLNEATEKVNFYDDFIQITEKISNSTDTSH